MNTFKKIKSMDINEFAEWLSQLDNVFRDKPWTDWFDDNYCNKCEPEIGYIGDRKCSFSWCELNQKCKHFQDLNDIPDYKQTIKLWLESEA